MNDKLNYTLKRSKRKTLAVSIRDGQVSVKAPKSASTAEIELFLSKHAEWIAKKLAEYGAKTDMLKPVTDGDAIMYHGRFVTIDRSGDCGRIKLDGDRLSVPAKYATAEKERAAIAAWFKRIAATELAKKLADYSAHTGLTYKDFDVTNARTKWGSCDGNCNIRLNWRLVMLDERLCEYVVIHELAHTVHHDHSAAFWAEVKKFLPQYAAERKRLKMFSAVTSMYR